MYIYTYVYIYIHMYIIHICTSSRCVATFFFLHTHTYVHVSSVCLCDVHECICIYMPLSRRLFSSHSYVYHCTYTNIVYTRRGNVYIYVCTCLSFVFRLSFLKYIRIHISMSKTQKNMYTWQHKRIFMYTYHLFPYVHTYIHVPFVL